ncbi:MAG: hypothetical protein IPN10_18220 [Saprospiraceae bacterium]|nr:hypothetical protein [Saprospiraceae bacterium]
MTGCKKAKSPGLVDELGGLNEAINKSKDLAKISEYSIVEYPGIKPDFY